MSIDKTRSSSMFPTQYSICYTSHMQHQKSPETLITESHELKIQSDQIIQEVSFFVDKISTKTAYKMQKKSESHSSTMHSGSAKCDQDRIFFEIIQKGDTRDLQLLKEIIKNEEEGLTTKSKVHRLINQKNPEKCTPLYIASRNGSFEFVDFLLGNGADWTIKSSEEKESCLEVASRWGHFQVVKRLLKMPWSGKDISKAAKSSSATSITELLSISQRKKKCSLWFFG